MNTKPRIFADFNNADPLGRIRLLDEWWQEDATPKDLIPKDGIEVEVYDFDLSADGVLRFSDSENIWVAEIDWKKLRYKDEEE